MDHMATLMIRSVVPNARQLCGQTFLQFLLTYAFLVGASAAVPV